MSLPRDPLGLGSNPRITLKFSDKNIIFKSRDFSSIDILSLHKFHNALAIHEQLVNSNIPSFLFLIHEIQKDFTATRFTKRANILPWLAAPLTRATIARRTNRVLPAILFIPRLRCDWRNDHCGEHQILHLTGTPTDTQRSQLWFTFSPDYNGRRQFWGSF